MVRYQPPKRPRKRPNIYRPPIVNGGTRTRQKHPPEFGDRVALLPYNNKWGIPGTVRGKTQWQIMDRRGWTYNILLCTGETVAANEYDFCLLPEDWEDFIIDPDGEEVPEPEPKEEENW